MSEKVYLSNIDDNAILSVYASADNKTVEINVKYTNLNDIELEDFVSKFSKNALPLEPILQMWEEKLMAVSFEGKKTGVELVAVLNSQVYRWKAIRIIKYKLPTGRDINVVLPTYFVGEKYNRRRGVRVPLDKLMSVEQDDSIYPVIVKDLSYCGVAVSELGTKNINPDKPFILRLVENVDGQDVFVGNFVAKVVNQMENNGNTVYGCELASKHAGFLQKYIARKQMEILNGGRCIPRIQKINNDEATWKADTANDLKKSYEENEEK